MTNDPTPDPSRWWLLWLLSTVVVSGIAGSFCIQSDKVPVTALVIMLANLFVQGIASSNITDSKGEQPTFLLFGGGWLLSAASFSVGCLSNYIGKL